MQRRLQRIHHYRRFKLLTELLQVCQYKAAVVSQTF
jgi:hypothetical protein